MHSLASSGIVIAPRKSARAPRVFDNASIASLKSLMPAMKSDTDTPNGKTMVEASCVVVTTAVIGVHLHNRQAMCFREHGQRYEHSNASVCWRVIAWVRRGSAQGGVPTHKVAR